MHQNSGFVVASCSIQGRVPQAVSPCYYRTLTKEGPVMTQMQTAELEEIQQGKKQSKHIARFEPAPLRSTYKSPSTRPPPLLLLAVVILPIL